MDSCWSLCHKYLNWAQGRKCVILVRLNLWFLVPNLNWQSNDWLSTIGYGHTLSQSIFLEGPRDIIPSLYERDKFYLDHTRSSIRFIIHPSAAFIVTWLGLTFNSIKVYIPHIRNRGNLKSKDQSWPLYETNWWHLYNNPYSVS